MVDVFACDFFQWVANNSKQTEGCVSHKPCGGLSLVNHQKTSRTGIFVPIGKRFGTTRELMFHSLDDLFKLQ